MKTIKDVVDIYASKIDPLDLELLISAAINKPREFVLAHPEYKIPATHSPKLEAWIKRRKKHEPLAYILGQKEFFGMNFKVNKNVLIPRPETELLVEEALNLLHSMLHNKLCNTTVIDVGTGSGNIIISLAKSLKGKNKFIAIDLSEKALAVAKQNAKLHRVDKKIKFLQGNLLEPISKNTKYQIPDTKYIILANLPYLSKNIYTSTPPSVKKYEPRSALLSEKNGLAHYEKLLKQLKTLKKRCFMLHIACFMEISPEQKISLQKLSNSLFPKAKIAFFKDLSDRWRVCRIDLQ